MHKKFLCLMAMACLFASSLIAQPGQKGSFHIHADGKVSVEGETYENMGEWQRSNKFRYENRRCKKTEGTQLLNGRTLASSDCTNSETVIQSEYYITNNITIPVVFHVISDTDGTGDISDSLIFSQIDILNEDFGALAGTPGAPGFDTHIRFELVEITRTSNSHWFKDRRENEYKAALGWDQNRYLNIYTNNAGGYLGYAYLPDGSAGATHDGVVLLYSAVGRNSPGGGIYNQGRTATHEVGHYLGLQHTFDGGCGDPANPYTTGDLIADTNAESTAHYDCVTTNTCDTPDPIENYMDYTNDTCMNNFTAEQANRMVCSLLNYRPNLGSDGPVDPPTDGLIVNASAYKVKGKQNVDLTWSGSTASSFDIFRDGSYLTTVSGGSYTDNIGVKGGGSYTYTVCEAGTATCANATATF